MPIQTRRADQMVAVYFEACDGERFDGRCDDLDRALLGIADVRGRRGVCRNDSANRAGETDSIIGHREDDPDAVAGDGSTDCNLPTTIVQNNRRVPPHGDRGRMTRSESKRALSLPLWLWLIPVAVTITLFEALQPVRNATEQIVWYSVGMIIVAATFAHVCRVRGQFDLFEPLNMVFALFLFFTRFALSPAAWLDDSWFSPSKAAIWRGLSASMLGFVCFAVGYKMGFKIVVLPRRMWLDRSWTLRGALRQKRWIPGHRFGGFSGRARWWILFLFHPTGSGHQRPGRDHGLVLRSTLGLHIRPSGCANPAWHLAFDRMPNS